MSRQGTWQGSRRATYCVKLPYVVADHMMASATTTDVTGGWQQDHPRGTTRARMTYAPLGQDLEFQPFEI